MIREYQQVSNASKIEELLDHKNEKVRKLAIEVLGDIKATESAFPLKKKYKEEVYENSLEIIKSLRKISNPKSIGFLQKVVDSEQDTNLQIEAVKAIAEIGDEGKIYLEKMMKSDYKDYNIIIKHVLDKRIN
jgi:HEAT repeat protein